MKILLIGATGQIGYALTKALAKTEHEISVLVRDAKKLVFPANIRVIQASEFTEHTFRAALQGIDHAIYGVGLPEQFTMDNALFDRINYGIFKIVLEAVRQSKTKKVTYISTYEVFQEKYGIIRETHPIASEGCSTTRYFNAMTRAYRIAIDFAQESGTKLTTIHPAAVYGGLNTGDSFTNFIENILHRRFWRVPFILDGRFPVVHADSLASAIVGSLDKTGAYIICDQMTTLKDIALAVRQYSSSILPRVMPLWVVWAGAKVAESLAMIFRVKPIIASVQIKFIIHGVELSAEKAKAELGWQPLTLNEGVKKYLQNWR